MDPEHRLLVSVVPGKRTAANTERLVNDFKERTGDRSMNLITSDEYAPYKTAILKAYGEEVTAAANWQAGPTPRAVLCASTRVELRHGA